MPIITLLALYLGLAYLTYATEGFYTYGFLDLQQHSSGIVAAYIVGILVASVIIFLLVRYVIMLRVWITERKMGKMGKFSHRGSALAGRQEAEKGLALRDTHAK